ncbi:methyl-accepting chemotaxis protein [Tenuibacillus multivorans]|uniref:Methyl-accepting chemotaxis protein n=1 Tax=Tenuibacillus multivorans TaxID=237069 RepID=A0A1H0EX79_9BACI|nr:HAMP domain-containing methyl-accepting chemotaxis protein [Tenuibacillus multivorans]GEL76920.1 putative sensory transducer protein YvaQ [Tenuibacillus multivorans]SDN86980.1 methyl-accepting chemotaxis protein [Tenuibacillus multivorans]
MKKLFRNKKKEKIVKTKKEKQSWWHNISIGKKYGLVSVITILLFLMVSGAIYWSLQIANDQVDAQDRRSERAIMVDEMNALFLQKDLVVIDYVNYKSNDYRNQYETLEQEFSDLVNQVKPRLDGGQVDLMNQISANNDEVNQIFTEEVVPAVSARDDNAALSARSQFAVVRSDTQELLSTLRQTIVDDYNEAYNNTKQTFVQVTIALGSGILVAAIISIILLWFISRNVRRNIKQAVSMADEIAQGHLAVKTLDYKGKDEIGQLSQSLNAMKENLTHIINDVTEASESVSSQSYQLTQSSTEVREGSEQIASTMQELSSGSDNQAQSASNISEMMESFLQKVERSYKNGDHVAQESDSVLALTEEGRDKMMASTEQMKRIHAIVEDAVSKVKGLDEQSQEISKLVEVIQDIAEQTNLLALNAAIEAARAGEHGKGFAVVADEVRKLAEQVADSVGDITKIVRNIQSESAQVTNSLESGYEEVEQGADQLESTQSTFDQINESVNQVTSKVQEISANMKDVLDDSVRTNQSVEEIASISEESAAGIEETAATVEEANSSMEEVSKAAEELSQLAEKLNGQVKQFKI